MLTLEQLLTQADESRQVVLPVPDGRFVMPVSRGADLLSNEMATLVYRARIEVLVPKQDNRGVWFDREKGRKFHGYLRLLTSGVTMDGHTNGWWWQGDVEYRDGHRRYYLLVQPEAASEVAGLLRDYVQREFRQVLVYVAVSAVWCTDM